MSVAVLIQTPPYALAAAEKRPLMLAAMRELTAHHHEACEPYRAMLDKIGLPATGQARLEDVPFLPVQLFKRLALRSVPETAIFKVLTSSGTTGQNVSRILLDRDTAMAQTRALAAIMREFLGADRRPMVIIDEPDVIRDRASFSARGAGILGFSSFGRDHFYLLDRSFKPDWKGLEQFAARHQGTPLFFFGFTAMVWQHFVQPAVAAGVRWNFPGAVLLHGGGWKRLAAERVDPPVFKRVLGEHFGINQVRNYYGMVEQAGSIFVEDEGGALLAPACADVIIRHPRTLAPLPDGTSGLIQVLSVLPRSYPGHSILTEDLGRIVGEDDSPCGRRGRRLMVEGRLPAAEVRGCSDTRESGPPSRTP